MSVGTIYWTRPPAGLMSRLRQWWQGIGGEIEATLTEFAQEMAVYAQATHPWQNLTGAAEAGLHAFVTTEGDTYRLTLSHGVPYGIWLEVRWGGRYAVILPTLEAYYGPLMAALQELVG